MTAKANQRTEADPMPTSTQPRTEPATGPDPRPTPARRPARARRPAPDPRQAPARPTPARRPARARWPAPDPRQAPARPAPARPAPNPADVARSLRPLLLDVGVPVGGYYLLHAGFGLSIWLSLALSSIAPAARAVGGVLAERRLNVLAVLMLAVNLAGIAVSFLTGDPRAMIAKDSVISSVIAFAILGSVVARRPLMSAGLKPFMTRGTPERTAAWDRLSARSPRFRRFEMLFSVIWGFALLADCVARLVGAYTLPVPTMVWLSTVLTLGAVGVGILAGGAATRPIEKMVDAEAAAG
jgi:hypothetical protein